MQIYISGKRNNVLSKKEIKKALNFFAQSMMSKRLCNNLTIFLENRNEYCFDGSSMWLDTNHRPREFEIVLKATMTKEQQLITLAHEMVHVKQYARGELKSLVARRESIWHGNYITEEEYDYDNTPWEIEAYQKERELYLNYMKV